MLSQKENYSPFGAPGSYPPETHNLTISAFHMSKIEPSLNSRLWLGIDLSIPCSTYCRHHFFRRLPNFRLSGFLDVFRLFSPKKIARGNLASTSPHSIPLLSSPKRLGSGLPLPDLPPLSLSKNSSQIFKDQTTKHNRVQSLWPFTSFSLSAVKW